MSRSKPGWCDLPSQHNILLHRACPKLMLCGDSIISGLSRYDNVWRKYFSKSVNVGSRGDKVENVLWRIQETVIPRSVNCVFLLCGTNNLDTHSPAEIVGHLLDCANLLTSQGLYVVISHILPRDDALSPRRKLLEEVNHTLDHIRRRGVYVLRAEGWTSYDGELRKEFYYKDGLHLSESGNTKLAVSITDYLEKYKLLQKMSRYSNSSSDDETSNNSRHKKLKKKFTVHMYTKPLDVL